MAIARRTPLLMIGAGGHARMCIEVLAQDPRFEVVGAVSADGTGRDGLGIPVLGRHSDLHNLTQTAGVNTFCVAIGDNVVRERIHADLTQSGWTTATLVSISAVRSPTAELGAGAQLMPAAVVTAAASIGVGTIVNTNCSVDHDTRIGDFVHIAPGAVIGGDVVVGDRTLIGLGARVLPGITIGADVVVGAGAVVVHDIADGATVVGVPARPLDERAP